MLLIGSEATLDWNIDPKGKVYGDRKISDGGQSHGAMMRLAKEYPERSGKVVVCGGLNARAENGYTAAHLSLRGCERYDMHLGQC